MITINFEQKDNYYELIVEGHARYAPRGQDLICALVSSFVHLWERTFRNIRSSWLQYPIDSSVNEGLYTCGFTVKPSNRYDAELVINTLLDGFQMGAESFPEYIKFNRVTHTLMK